MPVSYTHLVKENPTARTTNTPGHKIGGAGYFSGFKQLLAENTKARKIFISAFCLGLIIHATMIITPAHLENNGIDSVTAGTIYSAILLDVYKRQGQYPDNCHPASESRQECCPAP